MNQHSFWYITNVGKFCLFFPLHKPSNYMNKPKWYLDGFSNYFIAEDNQWCHQVILKLRN